MTRFRLPHDHSLMELLAKAPGYAVKRLTWAAVSVYLERYFRKRPDAGPLDRAAAIDDLREAESILLLCLGNICRSPFAERYLAAELSSFDLDDLSVDSAGLGTASDRRCPQSAIDTAGRYDVRLEDHRSRRLSADQLRSSDVIFVMDYVNYYTIARRHPEVADDTYFLGIFADADEHVPIPDPYGRGRERFDDVYEVISRSLDGIVSHLRERPEVT